MREAPSGAAHVGAELQAARERLGWSLSDVAANLRIRHAYLLALEEGRMADLPGTTYAVGFLRAYAKLLGLDGDEMSRRLRAESGAANRKTELEFPAPVPERGVPAGAVVLLGVLLAVGAYVGWYRMSGEAPGTPPVPAVPDRLATLAGTPAPMRKMPLPRAGSALAPQAPAPAMQATPAARYPAPVPAEVPPSSAAAAVPPPVVAEPLPPPAVLAAVPAETASAPPATSAANVPAAPPAATADSHIVLRAHADAWVQVRDQNGPVLLNRVLRAGETWQVPQQTAGQQPLLLTTGNAGGTELLVDGVLAPPIGGSGAVRRDLPLDPQLIRNGKLQPQVAAAKPTGSRPQPLAQ